jgi:peptide/nickel transport system permease protein
VQLRTVVLRRLLQVVPVLIGLLVVTFALVHLTPGDPARGLLTQRVTPQILAQVRHELGIDKPIAVQFSTYVGHVASGNLGHSYRLDTSVNSIVWARLPTTIYLVAYSCLISIVLGVPLAVLAAVYAGRPTDKIIRAVLVVSLALPSFWVGLLFVKYISLGTHAFPAGGDGVGFAGHLYSLFLPALTLSLTFLCVLVRNLRALLIEVIEKDFVALARLKGISRLRLYGHHIMRNAMGPAVTILGLNRSYLLSASVVVESVFAVTGIGYTLVTAVLTRDYQLVQGLTLVFGLLVVSITLTVDIVQSLSDPRRLAMAA